MPESYGPDPALVGLWLALAGVPLPLSAWLIFRDGFRPDLLQMLFVGALAPILVAVFTLRFRVTFTADSFVYRRWGPTIAVLYADISRIEVTNATRIEQQAIGAFVVTKQGKRLPFWPKLFPRAAVTRFFKLAGQR
jgi:hypothetical protein